MATKTQQLLVSMTKDLTALKEEYQSAKEDRAYLMGWVKNEFVPLVRSIISMPHPCYDFPPFLLIHSFSEPIQETSIENSQKLSSLSKTSSENFAQLSEEAARIQSWLTRQFGDNLEILDVRSFISLSLSLFLFSESTFTCVEFLTNHVYCVCV